jgi:NAD(P)-dependent dehydrogenase (short-subunit alcohol dehydrogenase family)
MMRFAGKTVLITGAASGFGKLAAERMVAEGAQVALGDVDERVFEVAEALGGKAMICDVSSEADQKALVELALSMGGLDVALNNAGIAHKPGFMADIPLEPFNLQMAVNVGGCFLGMKYQLPVMREQRYGAILNTASAAGLVAAPLSGAYAAAKHAVIGLTKTAADEYARFNVRVNAICPSFANTAMVDNLRADMGGDASTLDAKLTMRIPMGRVAHADEIVQGMLWAVSDENSFMTGQALALDGGLTAV